MTNDKYPPPAFGRKMLRPLEYRGEFGATQQDWEERIFRQASYFTVVRFGVLGGSQCATVKGFAEAYYLAHQEPRALIYAVAGNGQAFCIPKTDYSKYAEIWFSRASSKPSC
jgi:hypothetical protein